MEQPLENGICHDLVLLKYYIFVPHLKWNQSTYYILPQTIISTSAYVLPILYILKLHYHNLHNFWCLINDF